MRVLIGGGWDPAAVGRLYGPFLAAAGHNPTVACVVLDEGDGLDQFNRWRLVLEQTALCRAEPILVPLGGQLDVGSLGDAQGLLVCGGLTPAYADALTPAAEAIRNWLVEGNRPYAGFSAGAVIAADRALVGGYRSHGRAVCPQDAGEDLQEIGIVNGLGLVRLAIDVHSAQWGTLGRMVEAVESGCLSSGVSVDENTAVAVTQDATEVVGTGAVHLVTRHAEGVLVRSVTAGQRLEPGLFAA